MIKIEDLERGLYIAKFDNVGTEIRVVEVVNINNNLRVFVIGNKHGFHPD
jgi:hypothetical protein